MSRPNADITLDVDLRNPGQFFACCGVLELASRLWPGSEGWFAAHGLRTEFRIATHGADEDPLVEIARRICEADQLIQLAQGHEAQAQADRKPVVLVPFGLRLDWWLASYRGGDKSELKTWAGQQTPSRIFAGLRGALREILGRDDGRSDSRRLFARTWPMKGRFGFDPSASWDALGVGFSPDEQDVPVQTAPATEIFAAIGLQRCRPTRVEARGRWFAYRAWGDPIEVAVVPAAIVGAARSIAAYEFPVVMRSAQYGGFGWARHSEDGQ
ncbi:MAG: hypothetical protein M5U07_14510 [Xanthobacteraceae bacterium]|nr:hypothetical protein [Xanthobacteraceae bacterium]PWB57677.1 MAG: hypothetical protein C3F17_20030 [Bradyrhizobiaceae bacterium]